jgi:protocadherin-16/23
MDTNPTFTFSFAKESSPGTKFLMDQSTGVVMLVETLDFEEATEYELAIQVSDSVHHTEGSLLVCVLDANDNPPVFSQDFYQVTFKEVLRPLSKVEEQRVDVSLPFLALSWRQTYLLFLVLS